MIEDISNALVYIDIHKHLNTDEIILWKQSNQRTIRAVGVGSNANFIDFTKTKAKAQQTSE